MPGEACARTDRADPSIGKAKPAFRKTRLIYEAEREIKITQSRP